MHYKIFKSKKAITEGLREFSMLIIVALVIIVFWGFFVKVEAAFLSQKDDGSIANFNRVYNDIKNLLKETSDTSYLIEDYYIAADKILIGFDTYWNDQQKVMGSYNFYKPFKCGNSACLCIYNSQYSPGDAAKRDQGVLSCSSEAFFDKNVVFWSEETSPPKTSGLKRQDKGNFLVLNGEKWGVQRIYIEKKIEGGKTYIFISKIDVNNPSDPANLRKSSIDSSKKI